MKYTENEQLHNISWKFISITKLNKIIPVILLIENIKVYPINQNNTRKKLILLLFIVKIRLNILIIVGNATIIIYKYKIKFSINVNFDNKKMVSSNNKS